MQQWTCTLKMQKPASSEACLTLLNRMVSYFTRPNSAYKIYFYVNLGWKLILGVLKTYLYIDSYLGMAVMSTNHPID